MRYRMSDAAFLAERAVLKGQLGVRRRPALRPALRPPQSIQHGRSHPQPCVVLRRILQAWREGSEEFGRDEIKVPCKGHATRPLIEPIDHWAVKNKSLHPYHTSDRLGASISGCRGARLDRSVSKIGESIQSETNKASGQPPPFQDPNLDEGYESDKGARWCD